MEENYEQMRRGKADALSGLRREGGNHPLEYERKELQERQSPSCLSEFWRSFGFRTGASVQHVH